MITYKPGDDYYGIFYTTNDRGIATDADTLPVATITKNGVDDGTSPTGWTNSFTVTNMDTGRYLVEGTIPVSYSSGDVVQISGEATVDGETGKFFINEFRLEADVDSTGSEAITITKALEVMLAVIAGQTVVSTVDSDTKRVQFLGRDGATVIAQVDVSSITSGSREDSLIDPP